MNGKNCIYKRMLRSASYGTHQTSKKAKAKGTKLYVGINSDKSVRSIKGLERPILTQDERKYILENLNFVDKVFIFDELTPEKLIKELKPDVIVKGGDWKESEIIGADFVKKTGGEVHSIPLIDGFSTTNIIQQIKNSNGKSVPDKSETVKSGNENGNPENSVSKKYLKDHIKVIENLIDEKLLDIEECADLIIKTLKENKKILICGNGGSAADAQHIATEFVGRYETERIALPAIALTTDTSALTAITNDYSFERVFSRQVEALAQEGDLLIAISTSGNSENVLQAVMEARRKNCKVIGLTGQKGKKLASLCDSCILISSTKTANIQEAHITIAHIWCQLVDEAFEQLKK